MTWDEALRVTWAAHLGERTEWGRLDCCQFVREYVRHLTGRDYGADLAYGSESEAMSIITKHGDLPGLLRSILGEPNECQVGDVVVAQIGEGSFVAGVWQGQYIVGVHPTEGVVRLRAKIVGAWSCRRQ